MNPAAPTVLNGIARALALELGPATTTRYDNFNVQLMSVLVMMIAQEFDRAAERLVEENASIRAILLEAASQGMGAARFSVDNLIRTDSDLRVSALRANNQILRAALIELHIELEGTAGERARALESRVWRELAASVQRRHLDLALA